KSQPKSEAKSEPKSQPKSEAKSEPIPQPKPEDKSETKSEPEQNADYASKEDDMEIIPPPVLDGEMPSYFHVGYLAKMCLVHGYKDGAWKLQATTKTNKNFYLSSFAEGYPTLNDAYGGVEAYMEQENYHVAIDWLTDNWVLGDIGALGEGFGGKWKAVLKSAISTAEERVHFRSKIKCGYERFPYKMELVLPLYREPHFMGYIVVSPIANWLLGYRSVYNLERMGFERHAFCVGLNNGTTEIGLKLENLQDLRGSIFRRFNETWACALKFNLYGSEETNQFAIGGQYDCRNGTLLKARFQEDATIWFAYQTKIGEKINVLFHLGFKVHDPFDGAHKIGLSWHSSC
ncbi:hypothetical protein KR009_003992, partial [Drosophila setifemur]